MGLETGNRIDDLVDTNPEVGDNVSQGDDHIRLIKTCVQGSFPSLGSSAVTATAGDINKLDSGNIATEFVLQFNGRQGNVLPAADDYSIDQLSDVDTTTTAPDSGDLLAWDGSTDWVPVKGPISVSARYSGLNSKSGTGDQPSFTTEVQNDVTASGLATIKNDNTGGNGWTLTANEKCTVAITFSVNRGATANTGICTTAICLNNASTAMSTAVGGVLLARSSSTGETGESLTPCAACTMQLDASDVITVYETSGSAGAPGTIYNLTVTVTGAA